MTNQVAVIELQTEIGTVIAGSGLDWPETGMAAAGALGLHLGHEENAVALRVLADGVVRIVDREGLTDCSDSIEAMAREFIEAMPGENADERLWSAVAMLHKARETMT